ncbi:MAG: alpha subunit of pyruvate dehydrogenase, partial [Marteilia pararefringens]
MQTSNFAKSAQLNTEEMHFHHLDESLMKKYTEICKDEALSMLRRMITIRKMEDKANGMYKARNIRGFCHLSNGQEAANVGLIESISSRDVICDSYRMHGIAFLRGKSVRSILGELCGRSSGSSRGKGGSMNFYSKDNLYGGYGIVGSQVPIATGVAFAMKYREDNHISYPDAN